MLGIVILNGGNLFGEMGAISVSFAGEGFMLTSSLLGAISGLYTKKLTSELSPYAISAYQLLFGSLMLITLGISFSHDVNFTFTTASTSLLLYLGVVSALAFTLWSALLKHNKVSKVTIYKFSIPVFGSFLSYLFFRESFDFSTVAIALIFVVVGIILINKD
jgi:drug/metabolite transporter (DMT)-like permease